MNLYFWAKRWGVPDEAINELRSHLGVHSRSSILVTDPGGSRSEEYVQKMHRLSHSKVGNILWRNNVGVLEDKSGRPVRYGLANDTSEMNRTIKSSDLIGIRRLMITPDMVGQVMGQFMARETKPEGWVYRGTPREKAQLAFLTLVATAGGDAKFTTTGDPI